MADTYPIYGRQYFSRQQLYAYLQQACTADWQQAGIFAFAPTHDGPSVPAKHSSAETWVAIYAAGPVADISLQRGVAERPCVEAVDYWVDRLSAAVESDIPQHRPGQEWDDDYKPLEDDTGAHIGQVQGLLHIVRHNEAEDSHRQGGQIPGPDKTDAVDATGLPERDIQVRDRETPYAGHLPVARV
ncbi:hypothetical protein DJ031_03110 [bacterium endosymbiont of Escarpia laminata]|nr:MAG: hypothetical protein DJ031_03110 [bacterium endosymbiont of Escarpia laminata]